MHWFERKIRRYEHRRWTTDDNRRVQPFHWGLEHIGGSPNDPNPAAFVREYARKAIDSSREWYAAAPAAAASPGFSNKATRSSASLAPASAPPSATSLSFTMNAFAPEVFSTFPPTTPTSSARA